MYRGASHGTSAILQLLIDAGGDVNVESGGQTPLFPAVQFKRPSNVRLLMAQPCLDLAVTFKGNPSESFARDKGRVDLADLIAHEVRRTGDVCLEVR